MTLLYPNMTTKMLSHPPVVREKVLKPKTTFLYKRLIYFENCSIQLETLNLYLCSLAKKKIITSATRFVVLCLFCRCVPYKRATVISLHFLVPFTAVSFFFPGFILIEPFTVLVRDSCRISRRKKKFKWDCRKCSFQRHVAPQGTVSGK